MKFVPGLFFSTMLLAFLNEISLPDPGAKPTNTLTGFVGCHANADNVNKVSAVANIFFIVPPNINMMIQYLFHFE
jgi:hypothetical protein